MTQGASTPSDIIHSTLRSGPCLARIFLDALAQEAGWATSAVCLGRGEFLGCETFHVKSGIVSGQPAELVTPTKGDQLTRQPHF